MSTSPTFQPQPTVTLLMPNRDNATVLDLVLERIERHTDYGNFELIVVDDGSTDGSRKILDRWSHAGRIPNFTVIEREHGSGGVVDALNQGLAAAAGELVVQLDADASVETPEWLSKMVQFITFDDRIGVVAARVVSDSGGIDSCGIHVVCDDGYHNRGCDIAEPAGQRTELRKVTGYPELEWPHVEELAEVDGAMGTCMMYRREAALAVGGYDLGYAPVWLDDLDLTISMRREGLKVFYLPEVRVVHHISKRARVDDRPTAPSPAKRMRIALRRGAGAAIPDAARARIVKTLGWDIGPRWYRHRLAQHYGHWRRKWGWDLLNPDLDAIYERWGDTEICWASNPEMKRTGEEILRGFSCATA